MIILRRTKWIDILNNGSLLIGFISETLICEMPVYKISNTMVLDFIQYEIEHCIQFITYIYIILFTKASVTLL